MTTETLIAIHKLRHANGYMPTIREIAAELDLSFAAVQNRLAKLQSFGHLKLGIDRNSRDIAISVQTVSFQGASVPVLGTIN